MNERIRQLAEQACAFADIQYNKQTRATFYTNKSVEEFFREKFAELIVRECISIADDYVKDCTCDEHIKCKHPRSAIGRKIEQHFGVEQ